MKKYLVLCAIVSSFLFSACKNDDNNDPGTPTPTEDVVALSGDISHDTTLTADKKYLLKGFVYVTNGATLKIEAGTVIFGEKASKGTLVVTRGAKINATGTLDKPIVFTSQMDAGSRREGDWGGIILLGKAPINATGGSAKIEGGLQPTVSGQDDKYIYFGGNDADDNSGTMKYVRIEFAGVPYSPDNEINGLTFGGVGAGTTISYIQVYRSGDDAYEWFGGTVNCDHLIATDTWDDDFDTDNGFSGKIQFGLAQRYKTIADQSGSNGFESDNDANGSENSPQTRAIFSNMTIIGPVEGKANGTSGINANYQHVAQVRRNSSVSIHNSVLLGFPIGLYIDDTKVAGNKTSDNALAGNLKFKNNIIAGCGQDLKASTASFDIATWVNTNGNTIMDSTQQVKITDAYKFSSAISAGSGRPDFRLKAGSPALTGASFDGLSGFQTVQYKGAFNDADDWTAGWTSWDPENTKY